MTDTAILQTLLTRLRSYDTDLPVAFLDKNWNGSAFETPSEGMWIESRYFPNEPEDFFWKEPDAVQMGFFQVSVYFRHEVFETIVGIEVDSLIGHFPKGLELDGEIRVSKRPNRSPKITEDSYSYIPISIHYRGIG